MQFRGVVFGCGSGGRGLDCGSDDWGLVGDGVERRVLAGVSGRVGLAGGVGLAGRVVEGDGGHGADRAPGLPNQFPVGQGGTLAGHRWVDLPGH
jgi:hypothetical protein